MCSVCPDEAFFKKKQDFQLFVRFCSFPGRFWAKDGPQKNANSKKYQKAIDYYTQIISTLDENSDIKSDILYRRGGSFERLGNYKKADKDLLQSLEINPDDAYALN